MAPWLPHKVLFWHGPPLHAMRHGHWLGVEVTWWHSKIFTCGAAMEGCMTMSCVCNSCADSVFVQPAATLQSYNGHVGVVIALRCDGCRWHFMVIHIVWCRSRCRTRQRRPVASQPRVSTHSVSPSCYCYWSTLLLLLPSRKVGYCAVSLRLRSH